MTSAELILKTCEIPPVPMVAVKILKLVNDPKSNIGDLQRIIAADQVLTARVLRVANSAYYGLPRFIDTISDAVIIVGFDAVKMLALALSTKEIYKSYGIIEQKLWEHSIGVSIASGIIAHEVNFLKPEEAIIAGLLHDIGKVIINNSQPEKFSELMNSVFEYRNPFYLLEGDFFGFGHAEVGGLLAEKWGFSEVLCEVIKWHHLCPESSFKKGTNDLTLCSLVALADSICMRLGIGYRGPMADMDFSSKKWIEILNISEEKFQGIIEMFKEVYIRERAEYEV